MANVAPTNHAKMEECRCVFMNDNVETLLDNSAPVGIGCEHSTFNLGFRMTPQRILSSVLVLLLGYNAVFFAFHLMDKARTIANTMAEVQSLVNVLELIAVGTLFVDLVVRYDQIPQSWRGIRTVAVGLCVTGMLFKWFVLYLRLSYLVD